MSHGYVTVTADSVHNQEKAHNSPDPYPRNKWGLGTRLVQNQLKNGESALFSFATILLVTN